MKLCLLTVSGEATTGKINIRKEYKKRNTGGDSRTSAGKGLQAIPVSEYAQCVSAYV